MKNLVFLFALFVLAPAPVVCQDQNGTAPKKELRPFQAPELRVVDPIVASDEGCARDFVKALKLDGLEQRKYLTDLFRYGCVEQLEGPYYANILGLAQVGDGAGKIAMRKVHLINTLTAKVADGWILAKEVFDIASIQKAVDAARAQMKAAEAK